MWTSRGLLSEKKTAIVCKLYPFCLHERAKQANERTNKQSSQPAADQLINQLSNQPNNQPTDRPTHPPSHRPIYLHTHPPTHPSTIPPTHPPNNQPTYQSIQNRQKSNLKRWTQFSSATFQFEPWWAYLRWAICISRFQPVVGKFHARLRTLSLYLHSMFLLICYTRCLGSRSY